MIWVVADCLLGCGRMLECFHKARFAALRDGQ